MMDKDDLGSHTGHISHLGRTVEVRADTESVLNGLAEFYRPYYKVTPGAAAEPDVTLTCLVRGTATFSHDLVADMRRYRKRPSAQTRHDGRRVFHRPEVGLDIVVDDAAGRVTIVGPDVLAIELQARVLLRDQVLQRFEYDAGSVICHAAAAARDGRGVAVLGDRDSGKTTALLALMGDSEHNFVSADRVGIVASPSAPPLLLGVPARANVHLVCLRAGEPLAGLATGVDSATTVDGKVLVDPSALAEHFGVGITPSVPLDTVVLPRIGPTQPVRAARIEEPERIRALLIGNVLGEGSPANTHPHWLDHAAVRADAPRRRPDAVDVLLADIASRCAVYEFTGDRPSYLSWLADLFNQQSARHWGKYS